MNDLFATWHHSRSGVVEHLSLAQSQLVGKPGLEAAWAMVDAALAQVSLWLEQQVEAPQAAPLLRGADVKRLFQPGPQRRLGGGAGLAG